MDFKCEECGIRTTTRRSLIRHYKNVHDHVPDSIKEMAEKAVPCPQCGKEVRNLTHHKNFCNVTKMSEPSPQASSSVDSPSTSMATLQISEGGDEESNSGNGIVSDAKFFSLFKDFCVKVEGNKETTAKQYAQRLVQFCTFQTKDGSDFKFGRTLAFRQCSSIDDYFFVPTPFQWVETFQSNENKAGAVAAYIKLIDFLKFQLEEVAHKLKDEFRIRLKDRLDALRENAKRIQKRVSANIIPDRKERKHEAENLAEDEQEMDIPMEEMKKLTDFYRDCSYRIQMYEKLVHMKDAMAFGGETPVKIRNFLMLEMLFESGGQRPEVIRNITVKDLYLAKQDDQDGAMRVINLSKHKTSNTYGSAQIFVPESLYALLVNYHQDVRAKIATIADDSDKQSSELLFVAQGTGGLIQKLDQSCKVFMNVTKTKYNIIPKCFRYLVAHLGQASDDPKVREKLPGHMNHSQSTAQLHYVSQDEKRKEHSKMLANVYGRSKNLPVLDSVQEKVEETKAQISAAKKAKLEMTAEEKGAAFVAGPRRVFSDKERNIIKVAFADVPQNNLKKSDYDKAIEEKNAFKELVETHKDQGKDDSLIFKQVANSFRSMRRK